MKTIVAILYIYVVISIFLLFCNLRDTEFESREIEIGVAGPILTQKISKYVRVNDIHNPQDRRKILLQFLIFMELELFPNIL